jgi:hypothetical protein
MTDKGGPSDLDNDPLLHPILEKGVSSLQEAIDDIGFGLI